ncbi:hypothetical protein DQ384_38105 [Sphaerisporangium album]|uniref:S-adenosyl-L-homocysteine hydrolase NAD binding domain-containing protein n=1 Tax=Sphaerisporangium album TaxID=509200 RepID=A0A367ELU7_9ACTN|nr:NAD(P)-dependent oxidoreductase [Sphaerisporangium album]RCG19096.1 hypothetical protein DQ384_38105 [Sphaerisporangium album]
MTAATMAQTMPVLDGHARRCAGTLAGVEVLFIGHGICDAAVTAHALAAAGARLVSVVIPYGPAKPEVVDAYQRLGPVIAPPAPHPLRFAQVMRAAVTEAIHLVATQARTADARWMIVEDGGYAVPLLHDTPELRPYLPSCLGAVEHTSRGAWNYQYAEVDGPVPGTPRTLELPAVTISGCALKTCHEGAFVAETTVDEILLALREDHVFVRHLPVAVAGYGRIGAAIAAELAARGCQVAVIDPRRPQLADGMTLVDWRQVAERGTVLLVGATGTAATPPELVSAFLARGRRRMYLASASSKAVEFSHLIAALESPSVIEALAPAPGIRLTRSPGPAGRRYQFTAPAWPQARELVMLADGYPVLFHRAASHGATNAAMDPVMTLLFLAAAGLPAAAHRLGHRLHTVADVADLPDLPAPWRALIEQEGLLRTWCVLHGIDAGDYLARIGLRAPEEVAAWRG